MSPAQRQGTALARTNDPSQRAPVPIGPGIQPDPEQLGRIALAVIGEGRLESLTVDQQRGFLIEAARTLGLNPVFNPLLILKMDGKTVLYLTKGGAEQIASTRGASTEVTSRGLEFGVYAVTVRASVGGRFADASGAVPFEGADGKLIPVASRPRLMKIAETQGRRRAILGLFGLSFFDSVVPPDETEFVTDRHGNLATRATAATRTLPPATQAELDALATDEPPGPHARAIVVEEQPVEGTFIDALRASREDALARDDSPAVATAKEAVAAQVDEAVTAARAQGGDTDQDAETSWNELGRDAKPLTPRWVGTALGAQVSEVADQLTEAGKKFGLPATDATDADLEGWLSSKRGMLATTRKGS